jgi:hypothetical protein
VEVPFPSDELVDHPKYWGLVAEWVVGSFTRKLGEELAFDLTQEAIVRSLPGGSQPWVRGGKVPCPVHVSWIVEGLAGDRWKSADHRRVDRGLEEDQLAPDSTPDAEQVVLQKERRGRVADALRERFDASPNVKPVLDLMLEGVVSLEEHLARSGLSAPQVQNARARIAAFVRAFTEGKHASPDSSKMEASP